MADFSCVGQGLLRTALAAGFTGRCVPQFECWGGCFGVSVLRRLIERKVASDRSLPLPNQQLLFRVVCRSLFGGSDRHGAGAISCRGRMRNTIVTRGAGIRNKGAGGEKEQKANGMYASLRVAPAAYLHAGLGAEVGRNTTSPSGFRLPTPPWTIDHRIPFV
jgi:hypothetical protein